MGARPYKLKITQKTMAVSGLLASLAKFTLAKVLLSSFLLHQGCANKTYFLLYFVTKNFKYPYIQYGNTEFELVCELFFAPSW